MKDRQPLQEEVGKYAEEVGKYFCKIYTGFALA